MDLKAVDSKAVAAKDLMECMEGEEMAAVVEKEASMDLEEVFPEVLKGDQTEALMEAGLDREAARLEECLVGFLVVMMAAVCLVPDYEEEVQVEVQVD